MHPALHSFLHGKITLSAEHEALVARTFQVKSARRNEILVPKGAVAKHLYLVAKGCLRVFLLDDHGRESTRFMVFEGRMGTAFPSFIRQQPSAAAVQSLEASELLTLSYAARQVLCREVPGWETLERHALEREYIAAIERIEGFLTLPATARYEALRQQSPALVQRLPAKIIADYLGISPETLSRLKARS